jgi:hypothetical protein
MALGARCATTGIHLNASHLAATYTYGSKGHHLGAFGTKQEAALAYDRAARQCEEDKSLNYESTERQRRRQQHKPQQESSSDWG